MAPASCPAHALAILCLWWCLLAAPAAGAAASPAQPAAALHSLSPCPPGCTKNGNCNGATGKCECPIDREGLDCSNLRAPSSCEMMPGYPGGCFHMTPMTCECRRYCMELADMTGASLPPTVCYDVTSKEDVRKVLEDPGSLSSRVRRSFYHKNHRTGERVVKMETPKDPTRAAVVRGAEPAALSKCPKECSGNGACFRVLKPGRKLRSPREEDYTFKCTCATYEWTGVHCGQRRPSICPVGCSGRGVCRASGYCHCLPGHWGMDCSHSLDARGKPQLWAGRGKAAEKPSPSVYVYDLGGSDPYLHSAQAFFNGNHGWGGDYGRVGQSKLRDRLLASLHRTLDPESADYLYIPVVWSRQSFHVVEHIRGRWPHFDRLEGRRHLVFSAEDGGADEMYKDWPLQKWPHDLPSRERVGETAIPTYMEHVAVIQHMGQVVGTRAEGLRFGGMFREGLDILLPPEQNLDPGTLHRFSPWFKDKSKGSGGRPNKLFFAGTILNKQGKPGGNVRRMVFDALSDKPGMKIYDKGARSRFARITNPVDVVWHMRAGLGSATLYYGNMTAAQFCLAPPGMTGGWGRRMTLVATFGCIPLVVEDGRVQPFEDLYDPSTYTVRVAEKDVAGVEEAIRRVSPEQAERMRATIDCMMPRWMWTSFHGAKRHEMRGDNDVFASLMDLLRRRAKGKTGTLDPCKVPKRGVDRMMCTKDGVDQKAGGGRAGRGRTECHHLDRSRVGAWEAELEKAEMLPLAGGGKGKRLGRIRLGSGGDDDEGGESKGGNLARKSRRSRRVGQVGWHQHLKIPPGGAACVGLDPPGPPC